jgi:HEPN domain-containing protein
VSETVDDHAHIRYFKLLEVAYNCARNGHYDRAAAVSQQAVEHYKEIDIDAAVEARAESIETHADE